MIAVNSSVKTWKDKGFAVPGVKAKTIEVWGEGRNVAVGPRGRVVDTFAPLDVHIYAVPPAGA